MHTKWSLSNITWALSRSCSSWRLCSIQDHLIESWYFLSSSSLEEVSVSLVWGLLIKNDCMNLSNSEINSLCELILIIDRNPFFDITSWNFLNVFWNIKVSKLFLLHNHVIFSSFWRFSKLSSVRSLLSHLSEYLVCFLGIEILNWKYVNICTLSASFWKILPCLLKSLFTFNI